MKTMRAISGYPTWITWMNADKNNRKEILQTMTSPEKQLELINDRFILENDAKFMRGQQEHGGDFFGKPTVLNIRDEVIDLVNYTHVLYEHKKKISYIVEELHNMVTDSRTTREQTVDKVHEIKQLINNL